ncbi:MAG: transposase [Candidatus Omnitrophica bacterium]|nr:transposase [Candidatus Omnitrophota bacterium]
MPRTRRVLYDGVICHLINRAHNERVLFVGKQDFIRFKDITCAYLKKFAVKIYNYCLMPTHFHFLARIEKASELAPFIKGISQAYAYYYKEKYKHKGYLFQNRYKSLFVEKEDYLLECARYIERNPLRAHLVTDLTKYPWSSYNYYAKGKSDAIIVPNIMYNGFGRTVDERMKNYIEYVNKSRPYETLLDDAIAKMR